MSLHPQEIDIWCAMDYKCVVGRIFFETTNTADVYSDIIQQFIALLHKDEHDAVFQQDNVQLHVSKGTMSFLTKFFRNKFASGHHVAQIWALWTFFCGVIPKILSLRMLLEVLLSLWKKLRMGSEKSIRLYVVQGSQTCWKWIFFVWEWEGSFWTLGLF